MTLLSALLSARRSCRPASATTGLPLCVAAAVAALRARSSYRTEGDNARRDSSLPRKVKVPGRIHIHLGSVQVRASSAATGCDAATAIRPIVGTPRETRQRDCPARKAKARGDARGLDNP